VSDFFTHLAARARNTEIAVRPRLATRFEPVAPTPQLTEVAIETESVADDTLGMTATAEGTKPASEPRRPELVRSPAQPAADAMASPAGPLTPDQLAPQSPAEPTASLAEPLMPGRLAPQPAVEPNASPQEPQTPDQPTSQISLRPPPPAVAGVEKAKGIPHAAALLVHQEAPASAPMQVGIRQAMNAETALPWTVEPPRTEPAVPPVAPRETVRTVVGTPVPSQPLPAPSPMPREIRTARAPRGPAMEREVKPPAETIVHFSIGRIELRAPPAAPPRKREQTVSPVTPLADYLQQHAARARS
jgi:hypothetical protein